jgi:tetratricopeptide (TPR) repeat protein
VSGSLFVSMRRYDDGLGLFDRVLAVDPKNTRVRYWQGVAFLKTNRLAEAKTALGIYLAAPHLEPDQRSYGHYRLGQVHERAKEWSQAVEQYRLAVKIDGHKGAKAAIEDLEEDRKEGAITF